MLCVKNTRKGNSIKKKERTVRVSLWKNSHALTKLRYWEDCTANPSVRRLTVVQKC